MRLRSQTASGIDPTVEGDCHVGAPAGAHLHQGAQQPRRPRCRCFGRVRRATVTGAGQRRPGRHERAGEQLCSPLGADGDDLHNTPPRGRGEDRYTGTGCVQPALGSVSPRCGPAGDDPHRRLPTQHRRARADGAKPECCSQDRRPSCRWGPHRPRRTRNRRRPVSGSVDQSARLRALLSRNPGHRAGYEVHGDGMMVVCAPSSRISSEKRFAPLRRWALVRAFSLRRS
jgi:hypothetical protein